MASASWVTRTGIPHCVVTLLANSLIETAVTGIKVIGQSRSDGRSVKVEYAALTGVVSTQISSLRTSDPPFVSRAVLVVRIFSAIETALASCEAVRSIDSLIRWTAHPERTTEAKPNSAKRLKCRERSEEHTMELQSLTRNY